LILTGHQPELFHPGVWIKSFATGSLARKVQGTPVHVIIDNDTMKSSAIRVPAGGPDRFVVGHVPFDRWDGELPFEERRVIDESIFRDFAERVRVTMSKLPFAPIIDSFWTEVLRYAPQTNNLGERLAAGRRSLERGWGVNNLEVPLSRLCQTDSFTSLWLEIACRAPEFRELYNQALAHYRTKYKVRSRHHPASDLNSAEGWFELPFWVWRADRTQRQALWVRPEPSQLSFRAGKEDHVGSIPFPCTPIQARTALEPWKIRPRALVTTLYLRGLIADGFIHGIGGGKYDEVTDHLITHLLGWSEPPAMGVVTGTLFLPFNAPWDDRAHIDHARLLSRDAFWNPDRHISDILREREPIAGWIEEKQSILSSPAASKKEWTREDWIHLRAINDRLRPYVHATRQDAQQELDQLLEKKRSIEAVRKRDYPFCLHPASSLEPFLHSFD
jgi:hypothetical protein